MGINGSYTGSSPRVWGQVYIFTIYRFSTGIIPTRVGTRLLLCLLERFYWDHPHACGDKFQNVLQTLSLLGSSPRVWGQVLLLSYLFHGVRIIPTRVGTSLYICVRFSHKQDHPHACGDKAVAY